MGSDFGTFSVQFFVKVWGCFLLLFRVCEALSDELWETAFLKEPPIKMLSGRKRSEVRTKWRHGVRRTRKAPANPSNFLMKFLISAECSGVHFGVPFLVPFWV